jgi:hypothetical protein
MPITYEISDVVEKIGAPSERWVIDQIRAGRFSGRKIGRAWRMTEQDIIDALDACRNTVRAGHEFPAHLHGLTRTSRKRLVG